MKKYLFLVAILASVAAGAWASRTLFPPKPAPPPPPLPPEVIEVEVVKEIPVEGPERVVERVRWETREVQVEVPVIHEVERVVREAVNLGTLQGRAEVNADKFFGQDESGKLAFGWKGHISCAIRAKQTDPYTLLFTEPLDLRGSMTVTTVAPEQIYERWGRHRELAISFHTIPRLELEYRHFRAGSRWGWLAAVGAFESEFDSLLTSDNVPVGLERLSDVDYDLGVGVAFRF